jgi:hypothetical protein
MLNYKTRDIINSSILLKKNFDLLYFKELINSSAFIIYFNCSKISNKSLYSLKNEMLKKNIKSFVISSIHIKEAFEKEFKFLGSNMFFIFCSDALNFLFVSKLLSGIKFFYSFNKRFSSVFNHNMELSISLVFFHFIIFKLLFNLLIVILFYIISFIKKLKCN